MESNVRRLLAVKVITEYAGKGPKPSNVTNIFAVFNKKKQISDQWSRCNPIKNSH